MNTENKTNDKIHQCGGKQPSQIHKVEYFELTTINFEEILGNNFQLVHISKVHISTINNKYSYSFFFPFLFACHIQWWEAGFVLDLPPPLCQLSGAQRLNTPVRKYIFQQISIINSPVQPPHWSVHPCSLYGKFVLILSVRHQR